MNHSKRAKNGEIDVSATRGLRVGWWQIASLQGAIQPARLGVAAASCGGGGGGGGGGRGRGSRQRYVIASGAAL